MTLPEWFPDTPEELRFLTPEEGREIIWLARSAGELEQSLGVNVGIISDLFQAFFPLKRAFDNASIVQVREAERRMVALNDTRT